MASDDRAAPSPTADERPAVRCAGERPPPAAIVAVAAGVLVVAALVWGAIATWALWRDVGGFPRADVPGEVRVDVAEAGERFVYHERERWFARVPVEVDLDVEVTGPAGDPVATTSRPGTVSYRLPGLVGQAHATFDATEPGTYTVAVTGADAGDRVDGVAVGPSVTRSLLRDLAPPAVVLAFGLVVAVAATARWRRAR